MAKTPALAGLREALLDREKRLQQSLHDLERRRNAGDTVDVDLDAYAGQVSLLNEAIGIAKFPGMKPSEASTAASQSAARQASGQPPERPKMLAL
ncbi:hsp70-binding protein 1 [Cystoisospora suis]|uniref:Hsp70-binding protein 1 n=1 Tax=Cystoisospora suis TaxID=483139 RepID=A0A2C6L0C6_9APIC|nr:hsp70-binding protein 1 [Cystoisospora suis]